MLKNTGLLARKESLRPCFSGSSFLGERPRQSAGVWAFGFDPLRPQATGWAVRAAAHAAPSPGGAGRDRVGEKRGALPPPGVSPKPRDGEAWSPFVLLRGGGGGAVVLSPGAQSDRMFFGRPAGVGSRLALCMLFWLSPFTGVVAP